MFRQPGPPRDTSLGRVSARVCDRSSEEFLCGCFCFFSRDPISDSLSWLSGACQHAGHVADEPECERFQSSFSPFKPLTERRTGGRPASQDWLTSVLSCFCFRDPRERFLESMPSIICQQLDCHCLGHVTLSREPKYVWRKDYLWDQVLSCCGNPPKCKVRTLCGNTTVRFPNTQLSRFVSVDPRVPPTAEIRELERARCRICTWIDSNLRRRMPPDVIARVPVPVESSAEQRLRRASDSFFVLDLAEQYQRCRGQDSQDKTRQDKLHIPGWLRVRLMYRRPWSTLRPLLLTCMSQPTSPGASIHGPKRWAH